MPAERKPKERNRQRLDVYRNHHVWDTTKGRRTLDPERVDYYINNDLDLNELYDDLKLYEYKEHNMKHKHNNK